MSDAERGHVFCRWFDASTTQTHKHTDFRRHVLLRNRGGCARRANRGADGFPHSMMEYALESGRAGRDERPAPGVVVYADSFVNQLREKIIDLALRTYVCIYATSLLDMLTRPFYS